MCLKVIKNIKKEMKRQLLEKELLRRVDLITTLGEDINNFTILDKQIMTAELIDEFLALNPNSKSITSIIPASDKPRIRVGPENYEIRYNYDLRTGIDGPKLLDTSRDFCINLIKANKLYTRDEINRMENGFGLPVFQFAGGYYRNPDTGETTPFCRHAFYQNIVIRK